MDIIIFILVLTLIVSIHEFGHFYFARRAEILCHEFAVGMGPSIYQKRKGEVVYSIRAFPLGGYVSMAGEGIDEEYIKKGQIIAVNLNENEKITNVVLNNEDKFEISGKVLDFNLYGENMSELFIELEVNGKIVKYLVERDVKFLLPKKKIVQNAPHERKFDNKTLWQRFLVIFAGPAANFVLAFAILFFVAILIGKPSNKPIVGSVNSNITTIRKGSTIEKINGKEISNWLQIKKEIDNNKDNKVKIEIDGVEDNYDLIIYFQGLGFSSTKGEDKLIIDQVFGRAKELKKGDIIEKILLSATNDESKFVEVKSWKELIDEVSKNKNESKVFLKINREGKTIDISYDNILGLTLEKLNRDYVAYSLGIERTRNFDLLYPLYYPFLKITGDMKEMISTIGLLFGSGSGVGVKDLSGPVGIFSIISSSLAQGFISFLIMVAFLSVNIGFLNLLPIPALDGGRLVFLGYEAIFRRKPSKVIESALILITFLMLFGLIIFVTWNDILRLITK